MTNAKPVYGRDGRDLRARQRAALPLARRQPDRCACCRSPTSTRPPCCACSAGLISINGALAIDLAGQVAADAVGRSAVLGHRRARVRSSSVPRAAPGGRELPLPALDRDGARAANLDDRRCRSPPAHASPRRATTSSTSSPSTHLLGSTTRGGLVMTLMRMGRLVATSIALLLSTHLSTAANARQSEGPNDAGAMASDPSFGVPAWTTPANATASDDTYAQAVPGGGSTQYLSATNFGFNIPAPRSLRVSRSASSGARLWARSRSPDCASSKAA